MANYGKRSNGVKAGLHYILQQILDEAIKNPPYDFGLHDGQRPIPKQYEYFLAGKSRIDGYKIRGYHNYTPALALDFHAAAKGYTWDPVYLEEIARHIQKVALDKFGVKLTWGGDWTRFVDAPHLQLPGVFRKQAEAKKLY